jgi:hypothetical protein
MCRKNQGFLNGTSDAIEVFTMNAAIKTAEMLTAETHTVEHCRTKLALHTLLDLPATVEALPLACKIVTHPRSDYMCSPDVFSQYFMSDAELCAALGVEK